MSGRTTHQIGRSRILLRFGSTVTSAPALQVQAAGGDCTNDHLAYCDREDILGAYLNDTRPTGFSARQKGAKIQIVRENDHTVSTGVVHDLRSREQKDHRCRTSERYRTPSRRRTEPTTGSSTYRSVVSILRPLAAEFRSPQHARRRKREPAECPPLRDTGRRLGFQNSCGLRLQAQRQFQR